ncbi:MAG: hypothetical protein ACK50Y_05460 [Flavobacteriia bacterium]
MSTINQITLIDGTFEPDIAEDLIVNLLHNKVQFHLIESLSSWERTGAKDIDSMKRLELIKTEKERVSNLLNEAQLMGKRVVIKSTIEIDFIN